MFNIQLARPPSNEQYRCKLTLNGKVVIIGRYIFKKEAVTIHEGPTQGLFSWERPVVLMTLSSCDKYKRIKHISTSWRALKSNLILFFQKFWMNTILRVYFNWIITICGYVWFVSYLYSFFPKSHMTSLLWTDQIKNV